METDNNSHPEEALREESDITELAADIIDDIPFLGQEKIITQVKRFHRRRVEVMKGVLDFVTDTHANPEARKIMTERGYGTKPL